MIIDEATLYDIWHLYLSPRRWSVQRIATELGLSFHTVYRILHDPTAEVEYLNTQQRDAWFRAECHGTL